MERRLAPLTGAALLVLLALSGCNDTAMRQSLVGIGRYVGGYATSGSASDVQVVGSYAYVIDGGAIDIIDVSKKTSPALIGTIAGITNAHAIKAWAGSLFVASGSGLSILSLTVPWSPSLTSTRAMSYAALAIEGTYCYLLTSGWTLEVVDISSLSTPTLAGSCAMPGSGSSTGRLTVRNQYAYVSDATNPVFYTVNATTPASPAVSSTTAASSAPQDVGVCNGCLCATGANTALQVFSLATPGTPILVGSLSGAGSTVCEAAGYGAEFWTTSGAGAVLVDVATSTSPVVVDGRLLVYPLAVDQPRRVANDASFVYVAHGTDGLRIFTIPGNEW
jgi:hypothetical protein